MGEAHRAASAPVACTVVARNYLPAATVLAESYLRHHPDGRFVIAVIDAPWHSTEERGGTRIVGPAAFGIPETDYLRMATAYAVTELATAVKPYLLRQLRTQADVVIFLDPDIEIFTPMPELAELATEHQIVLTPHFLRPLPRDGKEPTEAMIMGSGIFNLGFIAIGPGSEEFLDYWAERLRQDAIIAPEKQLFTDQRWVDQVPALFRHHVLREPGFNVAYWNLHERPLRIDDGTVTVDGHPLRFFHFSGYRPEKPWLLTFHTSVRPRVLLSEEPDVRQLCERYRTALQRAGYAETLDAVPYGFAALPDGTRLTPTMRRLFRKEWVAAELKGAALPPHGFSPDGAGSFLDWLAETPEKVPAWAGLTRLTMAIWDSRPDLRAAFPQPYGRDAAAFRAWCRTSGTVEERLPDWAIPREPEVPSEPVDAFGVNILGYLTAELGVGELSRIAHAAFTEAGVPIASVVEDRLVSNRRGLQAPETVGRPTFPVSLLCVNADQAPETLRLYPELWHHRYRIGLWAWELTEFPEELHGAFQLVDEVWTLSEFCREAIAAHSPIPVKAIPFPVSDPGPWSRPRMPGEPVRFLFAFDFFSVAQRKNPWGLVTAFQRAFPGRDDVRLMLKTINADRHPEPAERLRAMIGDDPRIELIERYLTVAELGELYQTSDCYVSLHRSEGFGLTVAEAMVRGMPVISTDYSSTTEFLDKRTGWPVPYRTVPVGAGQGPYPRSAVWAEPDLDRAAAAMREVADDPAEAMRRGQAARAHILRTRSTAVAAEWMRAQLTEAYQKWRTRPGMRRIDADAMRPIRDAKQALHTRADTGAASRVPLAPAMRRVVLRALDHYDAHQRQVLGTVVDGVESTAEQLLARLEAVEARLAADRATRSQVELLTGQLEALTQQVGELGQLPASVDDLRTSADLAHTRLDALGHDTFEQLHARDSRADRTEELLRQVRVDTTAVHEAARLRHAPVPRDAEIVLCDAGVLLLPADDVFRPWLAHYRSWERSEAELLARLAGTGTFVDVGAHVGYHTLRLLHRAPELSRVVAVEANPTNAEYLRRNLAANLTPDAAARVTVLPVAAWDTAGEVRLVQAEAGNSGDHRATDGGGEGVLVPAVRLDQRAELGDTVSLIKTDLQGRDHRALAGLADVLERDRPHVLCEFCPDAIDEFGDDPGQVLIGYRKLGYRLIVVGESGPEQPERTDQELIDAARQAATGFLTLWLQPTDSD